jgi:hypothetical protein
LENCWENVHPDVLYVPQRFAGYPYWMVFTPYPHANDRLENPRLRVSYDGIHWQRVAGTPDPLVPPPASTELHHADPELVYNSGRLHVVYLTIHRRTHEVTFNAMSCKSDLCWTEPQVIHVDVGAVSPTFQIDGNVWHEWFIRMKPWHSSNRSQLVHREGFDLASLKNECLCHLEIRRHVPWHIDILKVEEGYEALIAAYPDGTDNSRTRLFHALSDDGLNFNLSNDSPIIEPSVCGWDNRFIYRSSFLKEPDGTYRIWYSGSSWSWHTGIGYVEGPLDRLRGVSSAPLSPIPIMPVRLEGDLVSFMLYQYSRRVPAFVQRLVQRSRVRLSIRRKSND